MLTGGALGKAGYGGHHRAVQGFKFPRAKAEL